MLDKIPFELLAATYKRWIYVPLDALPGSPADAYVAVIILTLLGLLTFIGWGVARKGSTERIAGWSVAILGLAITSALWYPVVVGFIILSPILAILSTPFFIGWKVGKKQQTVDEIQAKLQGTTPKQVLPPRQYISGY